MMIDPIDYPLLVFFNDARLKTVLLIRQNSCRTLLHCVDLCA